MRPTVQVPRRFDFIDLIRLVPRSLHDVGGVVKDLLDSSAGWPAALFVFFGIAAPTALVDVLIRETIVPDPDDTFRSDVGEAAFWSIMLVALVMLFALVVLLVWATLRISGEKPPSRTLALVFAAAELPQAPITAAVLAVFAAAAAVGVDTRFGSTFSVVETIVVLLAFFAYLTLALAAGVGISRTKAAATVALGPGVLLGLLFGVAFLAS